MMTVGLSCTSPVDMATGSLGPGGGGGSADPSRMGQRWVAYGGSGPVLR
jgi:hypothetical protein